jgi:hypothetical protein
MQDVTDCHHALREAVAEGDVELQGTHIEHARELMLVAAHERNWIAGNSMNPVNDVLIRVTGLDSDEVAMAYVRALELMIRMQPMQATLIDSTGGTVMDEYDEEAQLEDDGPSQSADESEASHASQDDGGPTGGPMAWAQLVNEAVGGHINNYAHGQAKILEAIRELELELKQGRDVDVREEAEGVMFYVVHLYNTLWKEGDPTLVSVVGGRWEGADTMVKEGKLAEYHVAHMRQYIEKAITSHSRAAGTDHMPVSEDAAARRHARMLRQLCVVSAHAQMLMKSLDSSLEDGYHELERKLERCGYINRRHPNAKPTPKQMASKGGSDEASEEESEFSEEDEGAGERDCNPEGELPDALHHMSEVGVATAHKYALRAASEKDFLEGEYVEMAGLNGGAAREVYRWARATPDAAPTEQQESRGASTRRGKVKYSQRSQGQGGAGAASTAKFQQAVDARKAAVAAADSKREREKQERERVRADALAREGRRKEQEQKEAEARAKAHRDDVARREQALHDAHDAKIQRKMDRLRAGQAGSQVLDRVGGQRKTDDATVEVDRQEARRVLEADRAEEIRKLDVAMTAAMAVSPASPSAAAHDGPKAPSTDDEFQLLGPGGATVGVGDPNAPPPQTLALEHCIVTAAEYAAGVAYTTDDDFNATFLAVRLRKIFGLMDLEVPINNCRRFKQMEPTGIDYPVAGTSEHVLFEVSRADGLRIMGAKPLLARVTQPGSRRPMTIKPWTVEAPRGKGKGKGRSVSQTCVDCCYCLSLPLSAVAVAVTDGVAHGWDERIWGRRGAGGTEGVGSSAACDSRGAATYSSKAGALAGAGNQKPNIANNADITHTYEHARCEPAPAEAPGHVQFFVKLPHPIGGVATMRMPDASTIADVTYEISSRCYGGTPSSMGVMYNGRRLSGTHLVGSIPSEATLHIVPKRGLPGGSRPRPCNNPHVPPTCNEPHPPVPVHNAQPNAAEIVIYQRSTTLYPHGGYDAEAQSPGALRAYAVSVLKAACERQQGGRKERVLRAAMRGEYSNLRLAGSGSRRYIVWSNPVWKGEWQSVMRYKVRAGEGSPGAVPKAPKKMVWEIISWNARNFNDETAAHMGSWIHERTSSSRRPGLICIKETWQKPDEDMPVIDGYSTVIAKPRLIHGSRGPSKSGGVAVYVHDALSHIVTDMECVSDGNFEGGIVRKVRDSKRGRNEFVAVIYGEIDRPRVNVYVDKRRMLLTINRWRQAVNGPMFVIGDQNIHAGSAQMEQWNSTLCTARMDTGPVPSYVKLDSNRGTSAEATSTTDHVLQPVSTQGKPRSALIRRPKVVCVDLGIETQDHYPVAMDTNISAPARQQRCKSKIVSRIGGATAQQIDGLQAQLRAPRAGT